MLNSKTVFVLGAGASCEIGFPLGFGLRDRIMEKLDFKHNGVKFVESTGDMRILQALGRRNLVHDYLRACKRIKEGLIHSNSIDDFIDIHRDDEFITECGKVAIAATILDAERECKLYVDPYDPNSRINFKPFEDTWYAKFYGLLTKQLTKNNLNSIFDKVIIVNFNYDRSIEHYLFHAINNHYGISRENAKQLVSRLIIYRPYGSVGNDEISFGYEKLPPSDTICSSLKTYTEQVEDGEDLSRVHEAINESEVIVFLGMAYHPNNMNLLKTTCNNINGKKIYCTRHGISDYDLPVVKRRIMDCLHPNPIEQMSPGYYDTFKEKNIFFADKCSALFDTFKLSLSEHYS